MTVTRTGNGLEVPIEKLQGTAGAGTGDHRCEHRKRFVHRAVEVPLGEGLGDAAEHRDVTHSAVECAIQATLVGHQDRVAVVQGQGLDEADRGVLVGGLASIAVQSSGVLSTVCW